MRCHCLDLNFASDSEETQQGVPKRAWGKGKKYWSGNKKRKVWGLTGAAKERHKYGAAVEKNRRKNLAMRSRDHS